MNLTTSQFCRAVLGLKRDTGLDRDVGMSYETRDIEMLLNLAEGEYLFQVYLRKRNKWHEVELTKVYQQILKEKLHIEYDLVQALLKAEELEEWEEPYHPYRNQSNYILR